MFKPSSSRYRTRSKMALEIHLRKTNAGPKSLSFLGQKIWFKIDLGVTYIHTYCLIDIFQSPLLLFSMYLSLNTALFILVFNGL